MSNTRFLIDLKNKRSFCLGDRYYSNIFHDVEQPFSLEAIEADMAEAGVGQYSTLYTPELAKRLWAFCEVADWKVETRDENEEGDDGFTRVGSVWTGTGDLKDIKPDPCAKEQASKEQIAAGPSINRKTIMSATWSDLPDAPEEAGDHSCKECGHPRLVPSKYSDPGAWHTDYCPNCLCKALFRR